MSATTGRVLFATALTLGAATAFAQPAPVKKVPPTVCQDFYRFVNLAYLKKADSIANWKVDSLRRLQLWGESDSVRVDGFSAATPRIKSDLIKLLEQSRTAAATTTDPLVRTLGNFYNSCIVAPSTWGTRKPEKDGGVARCYGVIDKTIPEVLLRVYVRDVVPAATKTRVEAMAKQLTSAMEARVRANSWMSADAKTTALAKLSTLKFALGYPQAEEGYADLTLSPTAYDENSRALINFRRTNALKFDTLYKGKEFNPYGVYGQYIPTSNLVEIPLLVIQPPFFDNTKDALQNYLGLGFVIAHEIVHAIDPQGAKHDAQGKPLDWWTAADSTTYASYHKKLVAQYNEYMTLDTIYVNGLLTANENAADIGAANLLYSVYKANPSLAAGARAGTTPDQYFFREFATTWRAMRTPWAYTWMGQKELFAPDQWRINGPLANMPTFAKAFGCKESDLMVRAGDRQINVW